MIRDLYVPLCAHNILVLVENKIIVILTKYTVFLKSKKHYLQSEEIIVLKISWIMLFIQMSLSSMRLF